MYRIRPGLTLGFYGCDKQTQQEVISGNSPIKKSKNKYDWLGHGIYFWEYSVGRAYEYADDRKHHALISNALITEPAVIGAVISLGRCLDLLDYHNLELLKISYETLKDETKKNKSELPENKGKNENGDYLVRNLDCAVIENIHSIVTDYQGKSYDSVRGVFWEGQEIYPGAGFKEKNHIQICIRNPNCIKGYFLPIIKNEAFSEV